MESSSTVPFQGCESVYHVPSLLYTIFPLTQAPPLRRTGRTPQSPRPVRGGSRPISLFALPKRETVLGLQREKGADRVGPCTVSNAVARGGTALFVRSEGRYAVTAPSAPGAAWGTERGLTYRLCPYGERARCRKVHVLCATQHPMNHAAPSADGAATTYHSCDQSRDPVAPRATTLDAVQRQTRSASFSFLYRARHVLSFRQDEKKECGAHSRR